jgi:hypothetical protein
MKKPLKDIIAAEYDRVLPPKFNEEVYEAVFRAILKPKPWYQSIRKEDSLLMLVIVLFVIFTYFIGFDADYQLTISLSKDIQKSLGIAICTVSVGIYLFLNEYFEAKKKIIL